ncbi:MAG: type II secretion system protein GspL [Gammaproteobacteria bacterium]|nr:MAG: type II secretion system protein GspL [Gammaproteobacteria bacterium]
MSENLFLQFQNSNPDQLLWFHLVDEQLKQSGVQNKQELSELKEQFPTASCIVLVPSNDCLVTSVALPTRQRRQQLKAIPFALEEQLAVDVNDMHFAIGTSRADDSLPVIAVAKVKMNYWLDALEGSGLVIKYMLPLSSLLEAPQDAWSIFHFNDAYIVNQNGNCWLGSQDEAEMMLKLSIQQLDDDQLPALLYWSEQQAPSWINALGLEVAHQAINNSEQALLTRFDHQKINLLQGSFSIKDDWNATWVVWRKVAVFVLVAILLKLSMMGFEVFKLNDESNYLKTEMARQYHLVVPGARITKNLQRQMKQLIAQRQGGNNQSNSFLVMLDLVAESITSIPGIQPTNLNYDSTKGEIRLDLLMANLPQLDQLKDHLVRKGLSIEVGAANAQGTSYSGRLTIRSGS